jgi:hypothetical protein
MHRISDNGAVWEVQVPHWRCDVALDDPTHKRLITLGTFMLFNQKKNFERIKQNQSDSMLAFEHEMDLEVCDVQFEYLPHWDSKRKSGQISEEELNYALNTFNNVALSMKLLIQVNKPGRVSIEEVKAHINNQ